MEDQGASEAKGLKQNSIVERAIADPSQMPDSRLLIGFLGKSNRDGYWRLYVTPELDGWVEFAEADVIQTQPLAAGSRASALEATVAWVKRTATLQYTQAIKADQQAEFLQGDITRQFLSQVSGDALSETQSAELIGTIIRTISRLLCRPRTRSVCVCTVASLCNRCPTA